MPDAARNDDLVPDAITEALRIVQGILSAIQGVVGEGASQALLRYGAFEEGKRLAAEHSITDLQGALRLLHRVVLLQGTASGDETGVRVEVDDCPVLARASPVLDTLLVGLLEGLVYQVLQARLKGRIIGRKGRSAEILFTPEDTA